MTRGRADGLPDGARLAAMHRRRREALARRRRAVCRTCASVCDDRAPDAPEPDFHCPRCDASRLVGVDADPFVRKRDRR